MTYKETRHELENDRDRLHNIYIAQTRTIHELQDEVARLQQIDKETAERVDAEFDAIECDELQIPCSKELDMEWANESDNIQ
jgi:hypothetical protein